MIFILPVMLLLISFILASSQILFKNVYGNFETLSFWGVMGQAVVFGTFAYFVYRIIFFLNFSLIFVALTYFFIFIVSFVCYVMLLNFFPEDDEIFVDIFC